ncbi:MAG TPA: hypothetical protein VFA53_00100 [Xanthobacteraceae bacterium]|nr:hypothetical protein [Xanthobacteraceae bacterium]
MDNLNISQFVRVTGWPPGDIKRMIEQGAPCFREVEDDEDKAPVAQLEDTSMPSDFINPQACTKRDVARFMKVRLADVDRWVREGCPHETTGKVRAPLLFNMPQVIRWYFKHKAASEGGNVKAVEQMIRIWDLELALAFGKNAAAKILGYEVK